MFKYVGVDVYLSPDLKIWTRETYSILDYLGDLGGLYDALYLILNFIAAPIASFNMQSAIMSDTFTVIKSWRPERRQSTYEHKPKSYPPEPSE